MSNDALDRAYDLIKAGDMHEAIAVLEPIIRADRNNEDAWWLLANATTDPDAKRNALINVLRLTDSDLRREKAEGLLAQIDSDPYDFDVEPARYGEDSPPYAQLRQPESGTGWSCSRVAIVLLGTVGLCACVACFGLFAVGQAFGDSFVTVPDNAIVNGALVDGDEITESITDDEWDAFTIEGNRNEQIRVRVTTDAMGEPAPFIFLYDADENILTFGDEIGENQTILNFTLPESGEYTVVVRSFFGLGSGDYTIEYDIR